MKRITYVFALAMLIQTMPATAGEYILDPGHTHIGFSVRHLVISNVKGRFLSFKGGFELDEKSKSLKSVEISIDASSINTEVLKRDNHLRSKDFLDVAKYPTIDFKMKKFKSLGGNKMNVTGDMTIHGVTREIVLTGELLGVLAKDPWGKKRAGFTAEGKINREDFGLVWNKLLESGGVLVGKDIKLILEIEGIGK